MTDRPRRRLRFFVDREVAEDVDREVAFHLEMRRRELEAQGWEAADARLEAERLFGDRAAVTQQCRREERRHRKNRERADMFDALRQDLVYALRQLRRRPAFTAVVLLTLALGVGAVTALFSLVDGVLLRALPYPDPERIVNLWEVAEQGHTMRVSTPNFLDWREQSTSFEAMALHDGWPGESAVQIGGAAVSEQIVAVSDGFFRVLGVDAERGRLFTAEEMTVGGPPAAVVSHAFWRDHLGARPLGELTIRALGRSFAVVGVLPASVDHPAGTAVWYPWELWRDTSGRTGHNWAVVARLADGVSRDAADAELDTLTARLAEQYGDDTDAVAGEVRPLKEQLVGHSRRALLFLLAAAGLVLIIAATNLACALLARAVARQQEMTVRGALGAGGGRLVRQLLTESVLVTILGGLLGCFVAAGFVELVRRLDPGHLPRLAGVAVDGRVLAFALGVSVLVGLIFGLVPALFAARTDLRSVLSDGSRSGAGLGRQRVWSLLVGAEVALALLLVVGSALMVRGLWTTLSTPPGFAVEELLTVDFAVPDIVTPAEDVRDLYLEAEREVARFYERVLPQLATLPGVRSVGVVTSLPLASMDVNGTFCHGAEVCWEDEERQGYASYRVVSDGYFRTMGIPLLQGRVFDERDGADSRFAAIVNQTAAERFWPEGDAVGSEILSGGMDLHGEDPTVVVGVVADVLHRSLDGPPSAEIYYPLRQRAFRARWSTAVFRADSGAAPAIRRAVREAVPGMPVEVVAMTERRSRSVADRRFASAILGAFAALALLLAAVGIWGVVSYRVEQRTRELGIRVALGAGPSGVLRLVVVDVLRLLGAGVAVGVAAALATARWAQSAVAGLESDGATLAVALGILLLAGLFAALVPARRAARVDPVAALTDG